MTFKHAFALVALNWIWIFAVGLHLGRAADPLPQGPKDEVKYVEEVEAWRTANEEKLRAPFGWLALTGHYWLQEGENLLGTSSDCSIKLPADLDWAIQGVVTVTNGQVVLKTAEAAGIRVNEKWIAEYRLNIQKDQEEADSPDNITVGDRLKLQLVRRAGRLAIRVRDRESSIRKNFEGKHWHTIRPELCVEARFEPYEPEKRIRIINIQGDSVEAVLAGRLRFQLNDQEWTLDAISEGDDALFVVFKDRSSGKSTYGPGRFLTLASPVEGRVTIDFNKAYNPPCAFSPHTLCPLPPRQNHLDLEINAGERMDSK
ncbi:MAG: DUF1684 domain-containing protein [Pirellula sp.]|jgi:uncharacterized protein (DUF1684 family)